MQTKLCAIFLAVLMLATPGIASAQSASDSGSTGVRLNFPLTRFNDTLFTSVDAAFRVRFDVDGDIWYTTEGGLVHVDPEGGSRDLITRVDGLPSSYSIGLALRGDTVYVGTDLGLAVVDRTTGDVREEVHPLNSRLPDAIVQELAIIDEDLWIGTRFGGVAIWDLDKPASDATAWTTKNTSTKVDYPKPVRRFTATPSEVWVATEGDGAWRYDRATGEWNVTLKSHGLPTSEVTSIAVRDDSVWFGTTKGLVERNAAGQYRIFNRTHGMPDERVADVDVLPTTNGTLDIFAATVKGLWQLNPVTGGNATRSQSFGILGTRFFDHEFVPGQGWLFSTSRGVSYRAADGAWHYFATGPTSGRSWGPLHFGFTSASVGESPGFLWFGTSQGLAAYRLPFGETQGAWQNFGEWQNYPGSVVNWIDTMGNTTWFGTNSGTYGFEHSTGRWIPKIATGSRNLVYGIEADRGELWIALFGDGLVMENLTTGIVRTWSYETALTPIPDQYLTDVRVEGNNVWLGASVGLIRLDRATGTVVGTYTKADGVPGGGVIYRTLPDGPSVWIGTKSGGVGKFDVASGKVGRVWNHTNDARFPEGEVRSLHREGGRLWVGTTEGLARIDVTTGEFVAWNQSNSDLVQNYVNGITSANGLLYLATLSGVQRMEIASGQFLSMRDGPGILQGASSDPTGGFGSMNGISVRIDSPRDGTGVTGVEQVRGTALALGGSVDRVEVQIGNGAWQPALGTESWTFDWDTAPYTDADGTAEPITIRARAFSGNATSEDEILVTPIAPPTIPLNVEDALPITTAYANRTIRVAARAEGDEPLTVTLFYRAPGAGSYTRLGLEREAGLFMGTIPARDVREGELRYYIEAQSGLLVQSAGGSADAPTVVQVQPAPRLAVTVEGPLSLEAPAGAETRFALEVTNAGTEPATFRLSASGLRASWLHVPAEDLALAPGETRPVNVTIVVPTEAFADSTTLTFEARDTSGVAEPAAANVPVRILAASVQTPDEREDDEKGSVIPLHPTLALFAAAAVALALRRRRS